MVVASAAPSGGWCPVSLTGRPGGLLAYLAMSPGRFFSRTELISVLWGDGAAESVSLGTFNTTLWRLRRSIEQPPVVPGQFIDADRQGAIRLHERAPIELDVLEFDRKVAPVLARPLESYTEADVQALRAGVALYTGDLLAASPQDWVLREREKHRRTYLNALGRLMQLSTLARDYAAGIGYAQAILDRDPVREDVHRELMRLYVLNGQRAIALRQFEHCRDMLRRELAIQPMRETMTLYQSIAETAIAKDRTQAEPSRYESAIYVRDAVTLVASTPCLAADEAAGISLRERVESARKHLAAADAQLQLSIPFLPAPARPEPDPSV